MNSHAGSHEEHGELGHIVPFSTYRNVFIALLIFTALTVWVAKDPTFDFGSPSITPTFGSGCGPTG